MKGCVLSGVLFFLFFLPQNAIAGDEVYKDENGVWRNRKVISIDANQVDVQDLAENALTGISKYLTETLRAETTMFKDAPDFTTSKSPVNQLQELKSGVEHRENMKFYNELNESKRNFEGYERFDASKEVKIKSEWEYFEDPR